MPEIVIVPALFGTICFIVWTIATNWQRNRHMKEMTSFNARVIDRIGSIKEFNDFLQSPGGTQFLNTLTADKGPIGPRERILRAVQTGIVLVSLSLGCLVLAALFRYEASEIFMVVGVILLSLGLGFLVAAGAAYGLSRRFGILYPQNIRADSHASS